MANKYTLGSTVVITLIAEELTDPFLPAYANYNPSGSNLVLTIQTPDGTDHDYSGGQIQTSGTGKFYMNYAPTQTGAHKYKWRDIASATPGIIEGSFIVVAPKLT